MRYLALVLGIGPGSRTRGVVAFVVVAAAFGAVFGVFAARFGGTIAGGLMTLARSNPVSRLTFGPFFRRVPLTTTTALVGTLYGAFLGLTVGRIVVPALVAGATPFTFELSRSEPGILVGFVAYGAVLGLGYGASRENAAPSLSFGVFGNLTRALVFGPVVGGLAGAAVLYVLARGHLASLALVADVTPTAGRALAVWGAIAFVLTLPFVLVGPRVASRGSGFVGGVAVAGFTYGVLLAVGLGAFGVPHYTTQLTEWTISVPNANVGTILGYLAYGTFLGTTYATCRQYGRVFPKAVADRRDAVLFSALVAGGLGGGVVSQAAGRAQLLFYGSLIGYPGSIPRSWAVWMTLSVLLAICYVAVVRPRDTGPGYVWRSTRRGALFGLAAGIVVGLTVVPAIVDGTTRFTMPVPYLDPFILAGYVLLGAVVGLGYGASVEEAGLAADGRGATAVAFGALLGGFSGGLVVHHVAGRVHIQLVGALGGVAGSIAKSWALWLGLALLLGVGFARLVSRSLPAYADDVSRSVERYPDLEAVFGPALDRAPLTTTATGIGLVYGVVASVVVGMLLLPMTVSWFVPVYQVPVPSVDLGVFLGYTAYGLFLGAGYGVMVEF
jgi:hypothetical protein